MRDKRVVISCGPIPARLDSVKYITNRFKGGLAMQTAWSSHLLGYDVTVVKWKYTELSEKLSEAVHVVDINDVFEYYKWFEDNACSYDAFIMAGAVANLTPSNPYEGKFPSHNYLVGEKFNIEFEIAPRAIDIIKKKNPRCCLIGYKLFDTDNEDELIEMAKHTLKDSKANIVFANTPKDAKSKKIAVFPDNTILTVNFLEHLDIIGKALKQEYFETVIIDDTITGIKRNKIELAKLAVKKFEESISDIGYGTIAIKVSKKGDFVTTSRGHKGEPVYVRNIIAYDGNYKIFATGKATLNAPLLARYMEDFDFVVHKHTEDTTDIDNALQHYIFPGTVDEYNIYNRLGGNKALYEYGHGTVVGYNYKPVDWDRYYELFPKHYTKECKQIETVMDKYNKEDILEVGCNSHTGAGYFIDPNMENVDGSTKLTYEDLNYSRKFKLIVLKNSINYLSTLEVLRLIKGLANGGLIVANTFLEVPEFRLREIEGCVEFTYKDDSAVEHYIKLNDSREYSVLHHSFNTTDMDFLKAIGFEYEVYNTNSVLLTYRKSEA